MILKRIFDVFTRYRLRSSPPSHEDPEPEFNHPENHSLFAYLRKNSRLVAPEQPSPWTMSAYELRAHPDLIEVLRDLVSDAEARKGWAYGRPVVANGRG